MKSRACLVIALFICIFGLSSLIRAETLAPELALDSLLEQLKSRATTETDFSSYAASISRVLKELKSDPDAKEVFRIHPVNSFIQEEVTRNSLSLYKSHDPSLTKNLEELISIFSEYYPAASSFLFKLKKIKNKSVLASECEAPNALPDCIFKIALSSDRLDEDAVRLSDLLKTKLSDPKLDKLSYQILSVVEKDYFKLNEQNACDDLSMVGDIRATLLEGDEKIVSERIEYLKNAYSSGSTCKELVKRLFPEVASRVCALGYLKGCLASFSIYSKLEMDEDATMQLDKTFILAPHSPESKKIAKERLSRKIFSSMSLEQRLKLFFGGMLPKFIYFMTVLIFIAPVIALIGYFFIPVALEFFFSVLIRLFPKLEKHRKSEKLRRQQKEEEERRIRERLDEYSLLLEVFGLSDDASVNDIKRAYRELIKRLHPDATDEDSQAEFERVQAAYTRLMELKSGWFGLSRDE